MVNVNLADYDPEPRITGIAVMIDGHIVLIDFRNHAVKLLDNSWSLKDSLWVEPYPSDVAVVDSSTVIVSSSTHLQFVHVLPHLKAGRKMKQFKRSEGVVVYGDEIYVLCYLLTPWGEGEVRVLGMNLKLKRRLGFTEEDKTYLFKYPLKIAINSSDERIFVSENHCVTCITSLDGHVVFKYDGLNCAGGLYCDSADNILLCGSKCIEVITAGGKKSTLLSEREFSEDLWGDTASDIPRQKPCSIAYRHSEETLIIGCFHFDSIFLFKLTK